MPEIPKGYKQTEVGIIPEEWGVKTIGAFDPFVTSGSRGWAQYYADSGATFLRITNLKRSCIYPALSDLRYVRLPQSVGAEGVRTALQNGDLLVSITADIGIIGYIDMRVPMPAFINQHIALVRFDKTTVSSHYVAYSLASHHSQRVFTASVDVGAKAGMNLTTIRSIQFPTPPTLPEQRAIAAALSDADAWIESLEELIEKRRAVKQGAMQALLTPPGQPGHQRLPGFKGEWEVRRLGDVAEIRSGGTPATGDARYWNGSILWCTPTDITELRGKKYLIQTERTISQLGLESSSAELIPAHSIVLTSRATIGECAINQYPVTTNQGFKNLVPTDGVDVEFLFYFMQTQKPGLIRLCGGSTFLEIGKMQLSSYSISLPSLPEQAAIAAVLSDLDAEVEALEAKLAKARQIKQGMMQELLTGRVRLV